MDKKNKNKIIVKLYENKEQNAKQILEKILKNRLERE